ncbi:MAG TPA: macro domain-containing protein [Thermoanaerobaculia bacterium]|jgi:O-acetyl-ADP-ribose deacetylase (regulator of RNase III)
MNIQLLRADIASLKVDALVAPIAARPQEDDRAVVVSGGNVLARFIIQVPVPHVSDSDADSKLRGATLAALERAEELAIASIGLPAMGAGAFGFPISTCAKVVLGATLQHHARARSLQRVVFCLFGEEEYAAFERELGELNH